MSESPGNSTLESRRTADSTSHLLLIKTPEPRVENQVDDASTFLLVGVLQMMLGVLMAVCGILALVHAASLASVGAGLWGGSVALVTGLVGLLTGLRTTQLSVTAFLAFNLVALAVTNLAVVLAVTGLVRDINREDFTQDISNTNWSPLLANSGLLLASTLHCFAVLIGGYRCYKRVCPCRPQDRSPPSPSSWKTGSSPEPAFSTSSKDQLIANWLTVQHPRPANILLVPQAAIRGHFSPIYTVPSPPISSLGCGHYMSSIERRYGARTPRRRDHRIAPRNVSRASAPQRRRKPKRPITEEDVAKTYTGLDRQIAEEFIQIAMEPSMRLPREIIVPSPAGSGN